MKELWLALLGIVSAQVVTASMIFYRVKDLVETPLGRKLITASLAFLMQGLVSMVSYMAWMNKYSDYILVLPLLVIAGIGVLGILVLYSAVKL